jgi:hypothetical protein
MRLQEVTWVEQLAMQASDVASANRKCRASADPRLNKLAITATMTSFICIISTLVRQ